MHFVDPPVPQESQQFARQRQRNHDKFVKDLLAQKEVTSAAIEQSRKYEPVALTEYEQYMQKKGRACQTYQEWSLCFT